MFIQKITIRRLFKSSFGPVRVRCVVLLGVDGLMVGENLQCNILVVCILSGEPTDEENHANARETSVKDVRRSRRKSSKCHKTGPHCY